MRSFFAGGCELSSHLVVKFLHIWCDLSSHLFDNPCNDAPDEEVVVGADGYGFILRVLLVAGQEDSPSLMDLHALDSVLSVYEADGLAAVIGIHGTVHDDDVALIHVGVNHRDAVDAEEEGRGAVLNKELHEVQLFPYLLCRRGETGLDGAREGELQGLAVSYRMRNHREEGSVGIDGGDQTKRPSAEARERTRFNRSESGS